MEPVEIEIVQEKQVHCDGGAGALGHPRIFLEMGANTSVECPYCGKLFKYEASS